jgi:hypothetical protein
MPYVTQAQIQTAIPAPHLNDALDDDRDGLADAGLLDLVIAKASQAVDAALSGIFDVPFTDPAPAAVAEAAFIFSCELVYDRRQIVEKNPFKDRADDWRGRLEKIGKGDLPLDATLERNFSPGAAVTENVSVDGTMR